MLLINKFKYLLVLISFLPLSTTIAQVDTVEWCPSGATWLYERESYFSHSYLKLSYVRDTTINNIPTKILATYQVDITGPGPYPQYGRTETYIKDEFYANVNDTIYWWNNGRFNFLYDFKATVNDEWAIHENKDFTCNSTANLSPIDTFKINSLQTQVFDGVTFNTIQGQNQGQWQMGQTIVKNIGSLVAPYPTPINQVPNTANPCQLPQYYTPESLSCYSDNLRGSISFNNSYSTSCSYFLTPNNKVKTPAKQSLSAIKIYPNPTNDWVHISTNNNTILQYSISDIQGRLLFQKKFSNTSISLEILPAGIYILNLQSYKEQYSFKIVKL